METQANTQALAAMKGVDAAKLEKQLSKLWADASEPKDGHAGGVVRACVLNLVVYANQAEREEVDKLLEDVTKRNPCRAIVLICDREAVEAKLDATASTRCQLSARGVNQICGEQITIEASGSVVERAATAVSPLLVPDVPVFLWWKDIPHYDDKLFNDLSALADRVVIDSASFDHPHDDLLRLAQILKTGNLRLSDLNWGRLTSWRSLVASFWDVADYRESLAEIESVRIEYDPPDVSRGEIAPKALVALGWIASCLGWEVEADGSQIDGANARFKMRGGGRQIEAVVAAGEDIAGRDGMVTSLTIRTARGDEFYVELRLEEGKLRTGARLAGDGGHTVGRVLGYEPHSEGQRLNSELDILTRDKLYENAVAGAAEMLGTLKK
ncbi:MAG: glucose-6-phosphate dehydrogenase assembly protein OpcA [Rubrivivax sp.]|nr:glucose-6-phosphate dehydrogenase assembly protein OpcA [Pyrinomonadaceae bacterium]